MNVLIVDDESKITNVLKSFFENSGYHAYIAQLGEQAIKLFDEHHIDIVILDLMLPDMDGEDICTYIKQYHNIPIIMLTAKVTIQDKIKGFGIGADDYVEKPFHPQEVVIRANRLLPKEKKNPFIELGPLQILKDRRELYYNGRPISMTPHEFNLFLLFVENPNQIFTRQAIIQSIFSLQQDVNTRTIDQHIKNLRKKLPVDYIQTVFGLGYMLKKKDL